MSRLPLQPMSAPPAAASESPTDVRPALVPINPGMVAPEPSTPTAVPASAPPGGVAAPAPAAPHSQAQASPAQVAPLRGVVTGPAKVMSELAQGDKLLPGDILVCKTTSPPWTVLFGRAAAVVAETGGALAHTAITAREYAIPCVVGARGATDRIHDGRRITVNGTEGVVSLPA